MRLVNNILKKIKIIICKRNWKKYNFHNHTWLGEGNYIDSYIKAIASNKLICVGKYTYGCINAISSGNSDEKLNIGSYCSIASNARFILSGEHYYKTVSTYPFKHRFIDGQCETICKGPIIIQDDVWIGDNALILSGVSIGQGAIIAAGSVVVKDIPPYAVAGGNPCRVIKYRFDNDVISKLLTIDWSYYAFASQDLSVLNKDVSIDNVDSILNKLRVKNK